jgi:SAM-dependent methyltransferase
MTDKLRDALRQAYDAGALSRNQSPFPEWKSSERAGFLSHLQAKGLTRLLEVGAGTGRDSRFFADEGCTVTCIDLSPAMVQLCRDKGLVAHVMDVADLSFSAASFDAVYSFNSLLHLPRTELPVVLRDIHSILVPGGLFYFGTYGGHDHEGIYEDDDHTPPRFFSFYDDEQLQRVATQSFEILSFQSLELPEKLRFQSLLLQHPHT